MKTISRFLVLLLVVALVLPFSPMQNAKAETEAISWNSGYDSSAVTKAYLKYKHLFNPTRGGAEGSIGPCESNYTDCIYSVVGGKFLEFYNTSYTYGNVNKLTLVYDGIDKFTATFLPTIDGAPINGVLPYVMEYIANAAPGQLNYLQLSMRGQVAGTSNEIVSFKNITLNGETLSDVIGTTVWADWNIKGKDLSSGFTLVGDMTLTWPLSGTGGDEATKLVLKVGYVAPSLGLTPPTSNYFCGTETQSIDINISDVKDLWGYQFEVAYDQTKVSAVGAFVNSWFNTVNNATIPSTPGNDWSAKCSDGLCKFAVTRNKATGVNPLSGSGTVANITFTGVAPTAGTLVTIQNDKLSDLDGMPIAHSLTANPATLKVCGFATVEGTVKLQGRATPMTSGLVTLTDGAFGSYTTNFDATTGVFSKEVKVLPDGTSYTVKAEHLMYLPNQIVIPAIDLLPGVSKDLGITKLLGGDVANDDDNIELGDMSLIGGHFNESWLPPVLDQIPDITGDSMVNIFDLAIAGGNYLLSSNQPW